MKWILWGSVIWLPALMTWMNLNEAKFKKNIVLGVTLPAEAHDDAEVNTILQRFRRNAVAACVILTGAAVLCALVSERMMTLWMLWIDFVIIVPYIPYVLANRSLKELKQKRGWTAQPRIVYGETSAEPLKYLDWKLFIPPVLIALAPILIDRELTVMYVLNAVMCILFAVLYRYAYREKAEMVDSDVSRTNALTRVRRYNWGKMWLITSYTMSLISILSGMMTERPVLAVLLLFGICAVICYEAVHLEMKTRRMQEKMTADSGTGWYVDEDDHWIGGLVYFNPDDKNSIINSRVGINSSVNMARPLGKVMLGMMVLLIVGMPFLGIVLDDLGTNPIVLSVEADQLHADSGMNHYTVNTDDITSAELLEALPEKMARRWGTGMEHYIQGTFSSDRGTLNVMCDPACAPYIYIETTGGKKYLFASREAAETEAIFRILSK